MTLISYIGLASVLTATFAVAGDRFSAKPDGGSPSRDASAITAERTVGAQSTLDKYHRGDAAQIVHFELVDRESGATLPLNIPKIYLAEASALKGGRLQFIRVFARIPDMQPNPLIARHERPSGAQIQEDQLSMRERIDLNIWSGRTLDASLPARLLESEVKRHTRYVGMEYGLEHYHGEFCMNRADMREDTDPRIKEMARNTKEDRICWPNGDDYFVRRGNKTDPDTWLQLRCGVIIERAPYAAGCNVGAYQHGWRIEYIFRAKHLADWEKIDNGVRSLFDSFTRVPN